MDLIEKLLAKRQLEETIAILIVYSSWLLLTARGQNSRDFESNVLSSAVEKLIPCHCFPFSSAKRCVR
jgi:hypothetical protein